MFRGSEDLVSFIKQQEGFRASGYDDNESRAIGYGDTEGDTSKTITEAEADRRLRARLSSGSDELNRIITRKNLSPGQQDALLDLHYNMGLDRMSRTGIVDLVNRGDDEAVRRLILRINKAKNPKTGRHEVMPGLVNRARGRYGMWMKTTDAPLQAPSVAPDESIDTTQNLTDEQLMTAMADLEGNSQLLNEMEKMDAEALNISDINTEQLSDQVVSDGLTLAKPEDLELKMSIADLAKDQGLSYEDAESMIITYGKEGARVNAERANIVKNHPAIIRWIEDPANFELMKRTGKWAMDVDNSARKLNQERISEVSRIIHNQQERLNQSFVDVGMALGFIDRDQGIDELDRIQRNIIPSDNQEGIARIMNTIQGYEGNFTAIAQSAKDLIAGDNTTEAAQNLLNALGGNVSQSMAVMKAIVDDFDSFMIITGESLASSAVAMAPGLAGRAIAPVAGLALGPVGAIGAQAAGYAGSFTAGAILEFGGNIQEELEAYKDPRTGLIDYKRAYSNEEFISKLRKEATTFGISMGAFSALYSAVGGRLLHKATSRVGGAKGVALGIAGETVLGVAEEGASAATSQAAIEVLHRDGLTPEALGRIGQEGVTEAIAGLGVGPTVAVTTAGARAAKNKATKTFTGSTSKTQKMADDAAKANAAYESVKETRDNINKEPQAKQNVQAVGELLSQSLEGTTVKDPTEAINPFDTIEDQVSERDMKTYEDSSNDSAVVSISPAEFASLMDRLGLDAREQLSILGDQYVAKYTKNLPSDTSFQVPLAEWLPYIDFNPEADEIARINGNELNAVEASEIIDDLNRDPFQVFHKNDDSTPPPIPGQEDFIPPVPDQDPSIQEMSEDIPLSSQSTLDNFEVERQKVRTRTRGEGRPQLREKIRTLKSDSLNDLVLSAFEDLMYERALTRARATGMSVTEVINRMNFEQDPTLNDQGRFTPLSEDNIRVPDNWVIKMLEGASPLVLLHEASHSWLYEMGQDYATLSQINVMNMNDTQLDYWTSMQIAAEFFGLDNMGDLFSDNKKYVEVQERFAQTAELYFQEGKANSPLAEKIMSVFRDWIANAVKYLNQLVGKSYPEFPPLTINDDTRRMFEGIVGLTKKTDEEVAKIFPDLMFDPKELGADAERYNRLAEDLLREAQAKVAAGSMQRSFNERQKMLKEAYDRMYQMANDEVDNMPAFVLQSLFDENFREYREFLNTRQTGERAPDPRISYESFAEWIGNPEDAKRLRDNLPPSIVSTPKKGGIDFNLMMDIIGINDTREFREMLVQMANRNLIVESVVDRLEKTEYPNLKSDAEIEQIAIDAVHDEGRTKLLNSEMRMFANRHLNELKGLGARLIKAPGSFNSEAAKIDAISLIQDAPLSGFNSNNYLRDSMRHNREAAKLYRQGDIAGAYNAKYREVVAFNAFKESRKMEPKLRKAKARIKQFARYRRAEDFRRTYDYDAMMFGRGFIQAAEQKQRVMPWNYSSVSDHSFITVQDVKEVNEMVDEYYRSTGSPTGSFTVSDFLGFEGVVRFIQTKARNARQMELAGKKIVFEDAKQAMVSDIMGSQKVVSYSKDEGIANYRASVSNIQSAMFSMFPNHMDATSSIIGTKLGEIKEGEANANRMVRDATDRISNAIKKSVRLDNDTKFERIAGPLINRIPLLPSTWHVGRKADSVRAPEIGKTFKNIGEVHMFMLTVLGSESGAEKVLLGGDGIRSYSHRLVDGSLNMQPVWDMVNRMVSEGVLRPDHFEMYQEIWDTLRDIHPQVSKSLRETDGYEVGFIEGRNFSVPGIGEFRGGYMPIAPMKDLLTAGALSDMSSSASGMYFKDLYPNQNLGLTKNRDANYNYEVDLDMNKIMLYVRAAANIAHMRKPMQEIGRLLSDPDVTAAFNDKRPGMMENMIKPWFDRTNRQQYVEYSTEMFDKVAGIIRRNLPLSLYLGNVASVLKQVTGIPTAVPRVGAQYIARASASFPTNAASMVQRAIEKDPVFRERYTRETRAQFRDWESMDRTFDWADTTSEVVRNAAYRPMQAMQNMVDTIVWNAAYDRALREGKTEKEAVNFARLTLEETQGSSSVSNLTKSQSGGNFKKLMTSSLSYPISMANMFYTDYMRFPDFSRAQVQAMTATGFAVLVVAGAIDGMVEEILGNTLKNAADREKEDDMDEEELKDQENAFAARVASNSLSVLVPIVGDWVAGAASNISGVNPALSRLSQLRPAADAVSHFSNGVELTARETAALMNMATLFVGGPWSAYGRFEKWREAQLSPDEYYDMLDRRQEALEILKEGEE